MNTAESTLFIIIPMHKMSLLASVGASMVFIIETSAGMRISDDARFVYILRCGDVAPAERLHP